MGKISSKVSKGLGAAIAEAQAKLEGSIAEVEGFPGENTIEALLNSGAEAQKKRKRRTKAEIEADKQVQIIEDNSLFEALDLPKEDDDRPEWEKRNAKNHEEFCKWELEKAKLKCLPEPDFDFRNIYEKGQIAFYVRISEMLGEKEVIKVLLRTIYPRMMVGSEEKACCHCIGYNERDKVFLTPKEADTYCKSIKLSSKYSSNEDNSKRKKNDVSEGEENGQDGTAYRNNEEEQTSEEN